MSVLPILSFFSGPRFSGLLSGGTVQAAGSAAGGELDGLRNMIRQDCGPSSTFNTFNYFA